MSELLDFDFQFVKYGKSRTSSTQISPNLAASLLHFTSWAFQIVGHNVYEGRAPAFTKDPFQALVLAPLFVFCECLFSLGLFSKTSKRLDALVVEAIREMDAASGKKSQ
eukprot:jgi/Hompol1/5990/HPOL_000155-RA